MADLQDVEISRGLLVAKRSNGNPVALPVQPAILAAAGLTRVKNHEGFRFEIDNNGGVSAVRVDESGRDIMHKFFTNRPARIYLGGKTYTGRTRGGHRLQVAIPGRGADLFQSLALLRRSHPRGAPPAGIAVTARFADESAQNKVRRDSGRLRKREDPWSPAWTEGLGPATTFA
jgi:hypothetical protein